MGVPKNRWVNKGKNLLKWMIWGYPYIVILLFWPDHHRTFGTQVAHDELRTVKTEDVNSATLKEDENLPHVIRIPRHPRSGGCNPHCNILLVLHGKSATATTTHF